MGMIPVDIPTLWNTWKETIEKTPAESSIPNRSSAIWPILHTRSNSRPPNPNTTELPTKPVSSATTVKMKSVCCSGTSAELFCVPWKSPRPVKPPLPMATSACSRL